MWPQGLEGQSVSRSVEKPVSRFITLVQVVKIAEKIGTRISHVQSILLTGDPLIFRLHEGNESRHLACVKRLNQIDFKCYQILKGFALIYSISSLPIATMSLTDLILHKMFQQHPK